MNEPRAERPFMPDYGVDEPGWEALPWSWARERLDGGRNYWLATASGDGRPHALPVWGIWHDDEQRFAFSCAPRSRKAQNLGENPQAVITIDDTVECLSVEGRATSLDPGDRFEEWILRYLEKYLPVQADLTAEFFRPNLMFEFEPDRAFAVIEREDEFSSRATRWQF